MKRKLSIVLAIMMIISLFSGAGNYEVSAKAKKVKLSTKKVTVYKGKTKTIKLKNANKKVKWKIKNKKVAKIVKKSGKKKNTVKVKGLKKGSTKIIATHGKKTFTARIVVKQQAKKNNPVNIENETTKQGVEITKPEATTEAITTKPETTTESVTTKPETTTRVEITETETTTEVITTKQEETTNENDNIQSQAIITAKAVNDKITLDDILQIEFQVTGKADDEITSYGFAPGKLEIIEDNEWAEVTYKQFIDTLMYTDVTGVIQGSGKGILSINLKKYYRIYKEGHYRYTHMIDNEYHTVEFDVYPIGTRVIAEVENDVITADGFVNIQFYAVGNKYGSFPYLLHKGYLEIYEKGEWTEIELTEQGAYNPEEPADINGATEGKLTLDLARDYVGIRPGRYRFNHEVAGEMVSVEFYVAYGTDKFKLTAKPVKETIEVGEKLKYELDVLENTVYGGIFYGVAPVSYEKLVDGEWLAVEIKPDYGWIEPAYGITGTGKFIMTADIVSPYMDNSPGHYRYVHSYEFVDVAIEFDIVE